MEIQWWLLILIIGGILLFLGSITALIIYLIRRSMRGGTRVTFFFPDSTLEVKRFRKIGKEFSVTHGNGIECKYLYDHKKVYKTQNKDYIYYDFNVPRPLDIKKGVNGIIDGKTLNDLMEQKILSELFNSSMDKLFSPTMIVLYIILIGVIVSLVLSAVSGSKPCSIINEDNAAFIIEQVKAAII